MKLINYLSACLLLSTSSIALAGSSLKLQSDAGDYIGQGKTHSYTDLNSTFKYSRNYANGITVSINSSSSWWNLELGAPGNEQLKPGLYEGAERFAFRSAGKPGLDFSGDGRGCNTITGKFRINEVSYDSSGVVTTLSATFEQHCEGNSPALRGEINYNLVPPLGVDAVGMTATKAICKNKTTGQIVSFNTSSPSIDCKKQGLHIREKDELRVILHGVAY
jgi:hypothetical protein